MSSTSKTSAQYPGFTFRRRADAASTRATSTRRSVTRLLAQRRSAVKNMAPEMVSASQETLASSNIVIGSSARSTMVVTTTTICTLDSRTTKPSCSSSV